MRRKPSPAPAGQTNGGEWPGSAFNHFSGMMIGSLASGRLKQLQVIAGTDTAYKLARAYKLKTAFGSDLLFSATLTARQGTMLTHLARWYQTPRS